MSYLGTSGWIKELNDFSTDGGKATDHSPCTCVGFCSSPCSSFALAAVSWAEMTENL